ncbi:MAG TPA: ABC transporter ATP-binding protein, partial [Thermoanaerobaculia bacterium]|nr:ABC transporter ATP-binding protein [Thermoanaerobaculia bacterium]
MKPLIVGKAVDALTSAPTRSALLQYAAMFVGAAAVEGIFLFLQRRIVIGASRDIEYDMRNDFYGHLQRLPLDYYQGQRTGDLMSRATNDLAAVRMLIGPAVMHSAWSFLIVSGAFIMMLRIDAGMATIALISIPIVATLVKFFGDRIHDRFRAVQDYFGELSARVQENLGGVRVVRAFAQEQNEIELFRSMNRQYVDRNRSLIKLTATFYPALHALIGVMFVIVFYLGSQRMLTGDLSIGEFVSFQFYLGRMVWPLIALGWVINLFQRGMASMKRLHEVWSVPTVVEGGGTKLADDIRGEVEIRNLTFAYTDRPVLHDVNVRVRAGETIGIVGRTGSGKSTLLALMTRTFEPPPRTIFIDQIPVEEIPLRQLRDWIAVVPQETFLFSDSIAENIRFGRADASAPDTESAADLAGLGPDVATFPNGLETIIGERGITLSGGQKQRTAIARALIRNSSILMLDDALSAVDTSTEDRILAALRQVRTGRTVFIVSHRVSSVKDADQILVLEEGRIVERGT